METQQKTDTKPRLDQSLTEETQKACKALLEQFPELRSVAIALDYDMRDAGSLPPGTWMPRRPLHPIEAIESCKAMDKIAFHMRKQHDDAVVQILKTTTPNPNNNATEEIDNGKQQEQPAG